MIVKRQSNIKNETQTFNLKRMSNNGVVDRGTKDVKFRESGVVINKKFWFVPLKMKS